MKPILLSLALTAFLLPASAQQSSRTANDTTMNRTVVVEQEYTPTIRDAGKVNVMPQVEPPTATRQDVDYDFRQTPARQIPTPLMQPYTLAETPERIWPGYVRAGYGNYGNLDLYGAYRFRLSPKDRLDVHLSVDGMKGGLDRTDGPGTWDARYYHTRMAAGYAHDFERMTLEAEGGFNLSNFNLLPETVVGESQKLSSGGLRVGVRSTEKEAPLQFRAETGLNTYSRRRDDIPMDQDGNGSPLPDGLRETHVHTEAEASGMLTDDSRIGVAIGMDNLFYNNEAMEGYTTFQLNPYYSYRNSGWDIRLGAHVDPGFGFAKKLRVAPDVMAEYAFAGRYALYLQARGGRLVNDFSRIEAVSPYAILQGQLLPTYEQVNAAVGFRGSPTDGLRLHLFAGYQDLKDDMGLYKDTWVGGNVTGYVGLPQRDTHNAYAGLEVSYDYKDLFRLSAAGTFRHWEVSDESDKWLMLPFKPAFESELQAEIHPLTELRITLGHRFVRREKVEGIQSVSSINNLYLQAHYDLFAGIGIYLKAGNLLNKTYQAYPDYPVEGIHFTGGVTFRF